MPSNETFVNAPIREAIIDIKFKSKLASLDLIDVLLEKISEKYEFDEPEVLRDHKVEVKLDLAGKSSVKNSQGVVGLKIVIEKDNLVLQFTETSFTISKLPPYDNWENFSARAKEFWNLYLDKLSKVKFTRLAVRYINEIELPMVDNSVLLEDYLVNDPVTPEGLPDDVAGFFSRVHVPCLETRSNIVVVQALKSANKKGIVVLLDFDAYSVDNEKLNEMSIWDSLSDLRDLKNKAFYGSLTDKCKDIFR
jgi:uncharacterized protein (TIGR04255 family)